MRKLKICFVASEMVPFAKSGGLADVCGALGKYLSMKGVEVRIFMPYYDTIDTAGHEIHTVDFLHNVPLNFGEITLYFSTLTTRLPGSDSDVYFIHCEGLYNRGRLYTEDGDEYLRFGLLSRAAIECCQHMAWGPDIFHCNDWQTALVPLYLKTIYRWDQLFQQAKTVFTIHNIGYQGIFSSVVVAALGLGNYSDMLPAEDLSTGTINFLKIGIIYTDLITTVSPTYASEIQTPEYGSGLHELLAYRKYRLIGILNGVDYQEWNPETDPYIPHPYSIEDLSGKEKNKKALLERMNLPYRPDAPLYGIISRLTWQKGFELLYKILIDIFSRYDLRFVVLGNGEWKYTEFFENASRRFPDKLAFYNGYNNELAHWIEAGSDMFVMPSRYEPCGLNQIYSLKYGTVPIVRKTGGLADTVQLYDWETQSGTGFVFDYFNSDSLHWAIDYAYSTFHHRDAWQKIRHHTMKQNFSWNVQAEKYISLYQQLKSW